MRNMTKAEMRDHVLACLQAKEQFRASQNVMEKEQNHERLFVLLCTLPLDAILDLVCDGKGEA